MKWLVQHVKCNRESGGEYKLMFEADEWKNMYEKSFTFCNRFYRITK